MIYSAQKYKINPLYATKRHVFLNFYSQNAHFCLRTVQAMLGKRHFTRNFTTLAAEARANSPISEAQKYGK
jgi:hypothetical protein